MMMTAPHLLSELGYCFVTQPSLDICSLQLHKQRGRKLYKCIESEEGIVSQLSREREGGDTVSIDTVSCVILKTRFNPPEIQFPWSVGGKPVKANTNPKVVL